MKGRTEPQHPAPADLEKAPAPEGDPVGVFILSAPEDDVFRRQLELHLEAMQREGEITVWHAGLIRPGDDVRAVTLDRMRAARVFLLLVSAAYEARCWDDQERILSRRVIGARVLPILVRALDWQHGPLGKLRPLPSDGRPVAKWRDKNAAWGDVTRAVREAVEEERRQPATAVAPAPFREDAARASAWRTGAEAVLDELNEILKRTKERRLRAAQKGRRMTVLVGAVAAILMLGLAVWSFVAR